MNLIQELKDKGFGIYSKTPRAFCTAFEDNNGALELATIPKMRSRTKHINLVYHHFRDHVSKGLIYILPIITANPIADILSSQSSLPYNRVVSSCYGMEYPIDTLKRLF